MKEKKSVLIITYFMVPYSPSWGNCQRMYFVADYLKKKGVGVKVICAQTGIKNDFGKEINFEVIPIELNNTDNSSNVRKATFEETISAKTRFKIAIKHFISDIYKFISGEPMPHVAIKGRSLVKHGMEVVFKTIEKNNIENVIISGPPFSIFNFGKKIKRRFNNVNLILDYRDPWYLWKKNSPLNYIFEKNNIRQADKIVTFSNEFKDDMVKVFNQPKNKFVNIFNGFSESTWSEINKTKVPNDKLIISHVGSINFIKGGYRDPYPFLKALSDFKYKKDILVRFVGVKLEDSIKKLKKEFGNSIEFVERVTHKESLNYMVNSHALILIHSSKDASSKYIISAKFFDYLRSERYIFEIGERDGLHRKLIKKFNNGISSLNDEEDIKENLMILYRMWKNGELNYLNILNKEYSRESQNDKYYNLIRG